MQLGIGRAGSIGAHRPGAVDDELVAVDGAVPPQTRDRVLAGFMSRLRSVSYVCRHVTRRVMRHVTHGSWLVRGRALQFGPLWRSR
jgi:hypothetical protein